MKEAAQAYHRERRGSCAQSVAHAWELKNPSAETSEEHWTGCGGGKAPGGLCGALHASCTLAGDAAADQIKREFSEQSGGLLTCRAIRAAKRLTCNECVGLAAELLEKHGASQQKTEKRPLFAREAGEPCRAI